MPTTILVILFIISHCVTYFCSLLALSNILAVYYSIVFFIHSQSIFQPNISNFKIQLDMMNNRKERFFEIVLSIRRFWFCSMNVSIQTGSFEV